MRCEFVVEEWLYKRPFTISGHVFTSIELLVVRIWDGPYCGVGEGAGVYYHGETGASMKAQAEHARPAIEGGADRAAVNALVPAGGARNAIDCALWDLEAQRAQRSVAEMLGLEPLKPLLTTFTLSANAPDVMAAHAQEFSSARALKLKLIGDAEDAERVKAVRAARPDAWLGVDANQGFDRAKLAALTPVLLDAGVQLIEQPFPIGSDTWLDGLDRPIPVAADESFQTLADLPAMAGRYDVVNIKLDKCGGLTEAMAIAHAARAAGLKVMVGNMVGTSLSTAAGALVGQLCEVVDLDGPLVLGEDRTPAVRYIDGFLHAEGLWGPSTPLWKA